MAKTDTVARVNELLTSRRPFKNVTVGHDCFCRIRGVRFVRSDGTISAKRGGTRKMFEDSSIF